VVKPRRVKVTGDLWHPAVPHGAVYVGRHSPGLRASPFANPFSLRRMFPRDHQLRGYLERALAYVTPPVMIDLQQPAYDLIAPITPEIAVAAYRLWLADQPELADAGRLILAGTDLACWCPIPADGEPDVCHGRVLLYIVNGWDE
jgi:Domain of unknown function (DUF4326)